MTRICLRKGTAGLVCAGLVLFLVVGGTAYASDPSDNVIMLFRNSPASAGPYAIGTTVSYTAATDCGTDPEEASITLVVPGVGQNTGTGSVTVTGATTEAGSLTVTATCATATNSPQTASLNVVRMDHIQAWGINVDGITSGVLKGSKETFTATRWPTALAWPTNKPVWTCNPAIFAGTSGTPTVTGTFGYTGTTTVTATCGTSSKTATFDAIIPLLDKMEYNGSQDVYDGMESWVSGGVNDPACWIKNSHTSIKLYATSGTTLANATTAKVRGVPGTGDGDITGGNYEKTCTFPTSWATAVGTINSASVTWNCIAKDTSISLDWDYRVEIPDGNGIWYDMGEPSGIRYYVVFNTQACGAANYTESNISNAIGKVGSGKSTEPAIASSANDNVSGSVFSGCICSNGFQKNFDAAMGTFPSTGSKGMCCCRAEGLNCVLQVLGIGPYTHVYINEVAEPNASKLIYSRWCATCGKQCDRMYWDSFWNNWEGAIRSGGAGTQCYAPAQGAISIDEGTYAQFVTAIGNDCGFFWAHGTGQGDTCSHLAAP